MFKKSIFALGMILALFILKTASALAIGIEFGKGGIIEKLEPFIEVVNLGLAIIVIVLSLMGLKKAGGTIHSAWILLVFSATFFGALEIFGVLKEFNIFQYHGLADIIELFAIVFFLLTVRKLKQLF